MQLRHRRTVDASVLRQHVDNRQIVALADFEIEFVMRRSHFQSAGTEFRVDGLVGDNRECLTGQRSPDFSADQISITRIIGMHRHRHVRHNRFRTGRGQFQKFPGMFDKLISHIEEAALLRCWNDFFVRQSGQSGWIPIDHAATAVDEPLLIKIDKNLEDSVNIFLVERVTLSRPIR